QHRFAPTSLLPAIGYKLSAIAKRACRTLADGGRSTASPLPPYSRLSAISYRLSPNAHAAPWQMEGEASLRPYTLLPAIGYRLSAIGYRLSAIAKRACRTLADGGRSTASPLHPTPGYRLSPIGYRLSIVSLRDLHYLPLLNESLFTN
uniref:hypothetical protein n=1 Tax=uncultured Chloroflexus sp. TaxID=214040 RepID=UPI00262953FF